jgi:hypothetical protein
MNQEARRQAIERAKAVMATHQESLLAKANVVGVGVGFVQRGGQRTDEVGLVVMVRQKVDRSQLAAADLVPQQIAGVTVDVQATGGIWAQ